MSYGIAVIAWLRGSRRTWATGAYRRRLHALAARSQCDAGLAVDIDELQHVARINKVRVFDCGLTYQISGQNHGSRRNTFEMSQSVSPGFTTYSSGALAERGILLPVAMVRFDSCAMEPTGTRPAGTSNWQSGREELPDERSKSQLS